MFFLAIIILVAVLIVGGISWYASGRAIHPWQNAYEWGLRDYPNLDPEPVRFHSRDGLQLAGRFYAGPDPATIVLSHGYGDNQDQMIFWADLVNRAGFSAFTYDMRDRGQSGGSAVTLGAQEQIDLLSAVDYLTNRQDVDQDRIGALGVSLGASVTILAAAQDTRIRAIVADSGFSDATNVISNSFHRFMHLPAFPFAPVTVKFAEWRTGCSVHEIRPVDVIGQLSPRPILIIHGKDDSLVPPENSEQNFESAGQPKQIWWVPEAEHVEAAVLDPMMYGTRVSEFFRLSLGIPAPSTMQQRT